MAESIVQRIIRVCREEMHSYLAIIIMMFVVIALFFLLFPVADILREPVLWVMGGIAISGWILAMIISHYPFLILGVLLGLLIAVLLIRKIRNRGQ